MKTVIAFFAGMFLLAVSYSSVEAQDVGNILASVADGIKPEAFKGNWDKVSGDWKDQVANLDPSNLENVTGSIGTLMGSLKDNAFMDGAKKEIMKQLSNVGSLGDLKGLLTSLISGLNPSMLKPEFLAKKDTLMQGLELIN
jgi:hypothetical protein